MIYLHGLGIRVGRTREAFGEVAKTSESSDGQLVQSTIGWSVKFLIVIPTCQILELTLSWAESSSFAGFLNGWAGFHLDFYDAFPFFWRSELESRTESRIHRKLLQYRNIFFAVYVGLPTIFLLPGFFIGAQESRDGTWSWNFLLEVLPVVPPMIQQVTVALLEDLKVILTYKSIATAFAHVRKICTFM